MSFPWLLRIGDVTIAAHALFEILAYVVGFQLYLALRRRHPDPIGSDARWILLLSAAGGAAVFSKVLHHLNNFPAWADNASNVFFWLGGKTIVGGLIGGLAAVELAKKWLGIRRSTGDVYAIPLCVGMIVGRVGCFVHGTADDTYGIPTGLPVGMDLGDGLLRHPTALYEIVFLVLLAGGLVLLRSRLETPGMLFVTFMASYMAFRLAVDSIKPYPRVGGLCALQWAELGALIYYAFVVKRAYR